MALHDHLEKLRYFYEVSNSGSIKDASQKLYITQPSITKSIKILEDSLNKSLFIRHPRGVSLTVEGKILQNYCHTLFAQLQDVEKRILTPEDPFSGVLRVGTYDSIAIYFWPNFLKKFLKLYPNLDIELTTNRSLVIQKKVETNELDLGLIIEPKESFLMETDILSEDSFQLYASKDVSLKELKSNQLPLIYMPDALAGDEVFKLNNLFSLKSVFKKHFKTSSLESTKELTLNGLGIGLLPKMVASDSLRKKKLKLVKLDETIKNGFGKHRIGLVYPNQNKQSDTFSALLNSIKDFNWT